MIPSFYTTTKISQKFGANPAKYKPYGFNSHEGCDFANSYYYAGMLIPWKVPVPAIEAGTVTFSGNKYNNYGNVVIVDSPSGEWWYCHVDSCSVPVGTRVGVGQQVAITGKSGNTKYYHLHLGWRKKPMNYNNGWKGFEDPMHYILLNNKPTNMEMPYGKGDLIITDTGKNTLGFRREPSVNGEELAVSGLPAKGRLPNGTKLEVLGGSQEADGYLWIDVDVRPSYPGEVTFATGFVAIKKADGASYTRLFKKAEDIQKDSAKGILELIKTKQQEITDLYNQLSNKL